MSTITWRIAAFEELTTREFHDLLRLRIDVFVVEQACPYPELDGLDITALHVMGTNEQGDLVAVARILPPVNDGPPHIGRVVVRIDHRGLGIATALMHTAIAHTEQRYGPCIIALAAQAHLEHFYAQLGFVRHGQVYDLDGIPHVDMERRPRS